MLVSSRAVPLTFVVGAARDVFSPDLAAAVDSELKKRFSLPRAADGEPYRSDDVDPRGWIELQKRFPHLSGIDAYQAVFVPASVAQVEDIALPNVADPLQVAGLDALVNALRDFAGTSSLPTDDVELMQLAARYLEDDELINSELDVQTYVQLMLSAKQASARRQALWIVG